MNDIYLSRWYLTSFKKLGKRANIAAVLSVTEKAHETNDGITVAQWRS
jgi:hypothetical protein